MIKILLLEDEVDLAEITADTLQLYEFKVFHARDAGEGSVLFFKENPDLLIVDIMMPGQNGYEFVKNIRAHNSTIPIIFLTAKSQLSDLVRGFNTGANDYVKKPFQYEELIARIKALLRFPTEEVSKIKSKKYLVGQYAFDTETQELISNINHYQLSFKEAELLKRLCEQMNRTVDRKELLLELWGDDNYFNSRNLNVFITKLRKYLADDPQVQILNLRAIGFKLLVKQ
jgi:DNA-binding response OmpR family regulator